MMEASDIIDGREVFRPFQSLWTVSKVSIVCECRRNAEDILFNRPPPRHAASDFQAVFSPEAFGLSTLPGNGGTEAVEVALGPLDRPDKLFFLHFPRFYPVLGCDAFDLI